MLPCHPSSPLHSAFGRGAVHLPGCSLPQPRSRSDPDADPNFKSKSSYIGSGRPNRAWIISHHCSTGEMDKMMRTWSRRHVSRQERLSGRNGPHTDRKFHGPNVASSRTMYYARHFGPSDRHWRVVLFHQAQDGMTTKTHQSSGAVGTIVHPQPRRKQNSETIEPLVLRDRHFVTPPCLSSCETERHELTPLVRCGSTAQQKPSPSSKPDFAIPVVRRCAIPALTPIEMSKLRGRSCCHGGMVPA